MYVHAYIFTLPGVCCYAHVDDANGNSCVVYV
jgi:hypothetical protein